MTQHQRGWLLPPASIMLVAGVFIGRNLVFPLYSIAACVLCLTAAVIMKGRFRFSACLAFCFALGVTAGCFAFHPYMPDEKDYDVRGVVCDEITYGSFGQVRIPLTEIALDDRPFSGGAYWTFYSDEIPENLSPGCSVSFRASLYHPRGAVNPGGYDFRESLLQKGISIGLYGCDGLAVGRPVRFSPAGFFASCRHSLSGALISSLGEETGAYASALLLGMRSLIPSEDRDSFSRLGIAHILSVSGFHVSVLISALSLIFRLLRLRPSVRLALYALLLFCYSALCGMNQPVIRASLLLVLSLEGRILNRPRSGIHLLSAALFIMTLLSPVQVTSASFQLTFCAVFGLLWMMPYAIRFRSSLGKVPGIIAESLILTFGIQLGLLIPELAFFQRLPLLVFLINLPAMLISGFLISLFWFFFLLLPFPAVSSLLSCPLSSFTGFLLSIVRRLASLPGLTLWIHSPDIITVLGVILLFTGLCSFLRIRFRLRAVLLITGTAALILSLLPVPHLSTEYIQLSVGNADAAVLWDHNRVYVFDTGEDDGTLSSFLRARRLIPDAVVLTHLHADHAGGLKSMLDDEIPIRKILLPAGAELQQIHPDFLALLRSLQASGTEISFLSRGDVLPLPSGTMTVLWPESGKIRPGQDANCYSLVTRLILNGSSLLQTGDLAGAYEHYCSAPSDILKISHHGSPYSTSDEFLASVSPTAALLSCEKQSRLHDIRNRFGCVPVYGTPESGALTVRFEEGSFTVIPYLAD